MKRWAMIIVAFFVVMFIADGILIYLAVSNPDTIVESYHDEANR